MDISLLVPAYNVQAFLPRCLDSILSQSFDGSLEVIVVDDYSTDNTNAIIRDYMAKDNRVRIIEHSENRKLSQARASGFKAAKGRYIWHIDSDDWIPQGVLQKFYNKMERENLDVLVFNLTLVDSKGNQRSGNPNRYYKENVPKEFYFTSGVCLKFIRRSCVRSDYVLFSKSYNMWEDHTYSMELLANVSKVGVLNEECYFRYVDDSSMGNTTHSVQRIYDFTNNILPATKEILAKYPNFTEADYFIVNIYRKALSRLLQSYIKLDEGERIHVSKKITKIVNDIFSMSGYEQWMFANDSPTKISLISRLLRSMTIKDIIALCRGDKL